MPSTDPTLLPAYRFGQVLAVIVAGMFEFQHGVIVAAIGLGVGLMLLRVVFVVMRGLVFPIIEELARAISDRR